MKRRAISTLRARQVRATWPTQAERDADPDKFTADTILFRDIRTGEIAAMVSVDDLFDPDGNRFWLDA